jgi:hypothetical protein
MLIRQEPVINEIVFFNRECRIAALKIADTVAPDTVTKNQVLCPRRSPDRISLNEAQALNGPPQCSRRKE